MSPTEDYLTFITSIPNLSPMALLSLFFLALMRLAPLVAIAPFLGAQMPGSTKIGFAIFLSLLILPHIILTTAHPPSFDMRFVGLSLKELFIGFILAFLASIPFYIVQSAGTLIDFMRGSSALMVADPTMENQTSPIGILYNHVTIFLFFQIGGPFIFLDGVVQSYSLIPADGILSPVSFNIDLPVWQTSLKLLNKFAALSIQLAAPALVGVLMAELFLGIANRLAPQVQISFLGMSIKSLLGVALLFAGWIFILQQVAKQCLLWLRDLQMALQGIALSG
jgi:type III secretion protein T